ncbi:MAG: class I SAM-dependent methyltransferase [Clostridiaceae bacterium]|nr:class I SAM-dependent methyltransferase [Clostridiaceae bacterium]
MSERLHRIADNVLSGGVVADIGCDHGYTSICLIEQGKAKAAIALDINQRPLERAEKHIRECGMQDRIETRLSDGTEKLLPGEADTLLISGMGGGLAAGILKQNPLVTRAAKELVLSPQSEVFLVRRCVHELGFQISHEEMIIDQGKYYVVLRAVPGQEQYAEEIDYLYGKRLIEERDIVFRSFMEQEKRRVEGILSGLSDRALSASAQKKRQELLGEQCRIRGVIHRMKA